MILTTESRVDIVKWFADHHLPIPLSETHGVSVWAHSDVVCLSCCVPYKDERFTVMTVEFFPDDFCGGRSELFVLMHDRFMAAYQRITAC